uniref:FXYD domain-containing ion transport regulator n=1 Tax=Anabas testudineus TaxID=64144 RepID=A0A3Q1JAS9_ANATE
DSVFSETMFPDQSDFDYDYETLRTTGVILAVIMFVSGILIALTHLVPKFQQKRVSSLNWRESFQVIMLLNVIIYCIFTL